MAERWKAVVGWEGKYEVSDHGNVRSVDRWVINSLGHRRFLRGKNLALQNGPGGYVTVHFGAKNMNIYVHHIVMAAFVGPRPKGKGIKRIQICHYDGNKKNNHLSNLRYDTMSANALDLIRHRIEKEWSNLANYPGQQSRSCAIRAGDG